MAASLARAIRMPGTLVFTAIFVLATGVSFGQNEDSREPQDEESITFARMSAEAVQSKVIDWLQLTGADKDILDAQTKQWSETNAVASMTGEELLDRVIESFASVDPAARKLLNQSVGAGPVDPVIYDGIRETPFYRHQTQLIRSRWLTQHRYFDDALPTLTELSPDSVVDPAGLLFYRAICQSELSDHSNALDNLGLLLNNTLEVPPRFRVVAEALQKELSGKKDDGMGKVEQLMKDVNRRLDLGRSGEKTQGQEQAVIDAIDKLMEDLDKQNQQQGGGSGSGNSQQNEPGTQPASRSEIKGSAAEGKADRKELTEKGKWGMMNQKAEAKARELIRQKFPPNFLDQIGRYTRKLAEQKK